MDRCDSPYSFNTDQAKDRRLMVMHNKNRECKGCREEYRVTEQQIARVLDSPMFASSQCVPDEVYNKRLEACTDCPKLMDGHTCMLCGCIVQITAKLKTKTCPDPVRNQWHFDQT